MFGLSFSRSVSVMATNESEHPKSEPPCDLNTPNEELDLETRYRKAVYLFSFTGNISQAALNSGVNRRTFSDRLKRGQCCERTFVKHQNQLLLTTKSEKDLVDWIERRVRSGFSPTKLVVIEKAYELMLLEHGVNECHMRDRNGGRDFSDEIQL